MRLRLVVDELRGRLRIKHLNSNLRGKSSNHLRVCLLVRREPLLERLLEGEAATVLVADERTLVLVAICRESSFFIPSFPVEAEIAPGEGEFYCSAKTCLPSKEVK